MKFNLFISCLILAASTSYGVEVLERGELNLNNKSFKNFPITEATYIQSIDYDQKNQYLITQIDSTYFQHCKIPTKQVMKMILSESMELYYKENIKYKYVCEKSNTPKYKN